MKCTEFDDRLSESELIAWDCIKAVIVNCLGVHRSANFRVYINDMLQAFETLQVHMSLKIHFLHYHLDRLEQQIPTESDEHGEKFHQIAAPFEKWYAGKRIDHLIADICWNLTENNYE